MRRFLLFSSMALAVTAVSAVGAPPATADGTGTTFTLTAAGGLSVSVPASADLGSATTAAGSLSASLGTVTVTDQRGLLVATWTASVSSTDFTTGSASAAETIGKANISYASGLPTSTTGTGTPVPGQANAVAAQSLDAVRTAMAMTLGVGNNAVSWAPTVVVSVPSSAVVGTYSGTITHSVA